MEPAFASPVEQPQQRHSFRRPGLAPDDDDDAAVWLRFGEVDEVVTVAGHQQTIVVVSKLQNGGIGGLCREDVTEAHDFVMEFSEQVVRSSGKS